MMLAVIQVFGLNMNYGNKIYFNTFIILQTLKKQKTEALNLKFYRIIVSIPRTKVTSTGTSSRGGGGREGGEKKEGKRGEEKEEEQKQQRRREGRGAEEEEEK